MGSFCLFRASSQQWRGEEKRRRGGTPLNLNSVLCFLLLFLGEDGDGDGGRDRGGGVLAERNTQELGVRGLSCVAHMSR